MPLLILSLLIPFSLSSFAADVPDFQVRVGASNSITATPPADYHFNLQAPIKAETMHHVLFKVSEKKESKITFKSVPDVGAGDEVTVSLYLCDNAKTLCVKKTKVASIPSRSETSTSVFDQGDLPADAKVESHLKVGKAKKDEHGFWDNSPEAAITEAKKTNRPLLIDFYGIWCPPCNQFIESVWPTPAFRKEAAKFVLLKIDADHDSSWELKSRFRVGGYPTIVIAKPTLEEIDRVVGFYPVKELNEKLEVAYANRNQSFEERILFDKGRLLADLDQVIETKLEQRDFQGASNWVQEAMKLKPEDEYLKVVKLEVESDADSKRVQSPEAQKLLKSVWENREKMADRTLLHAAQLEGNPEDFALDEVKTLVKRINPKTLKLNEADASIGDLADIQADLATNKNKNGKYEAELKAAYEFGEKSYLQLLKLYGMDSRGLNIEHAYYLWRTGQIGAAEKTYQRFIRKYPKEFTFYFAASKMYLVNRQLDQARVNAEKAMEFSYGDNRLRAAERLVRVMIAQGKNSEAEKFGNQTLAQARDPKQLHVRTNRYVTALKNAVKDAAEGKGAHS